MLARWVRTWHGQALRPILLTLARLGVTPNGLTLAGLLLVVLAGGLLAGGYRVWGAWILLLGSLADSLDGELARLLKRETALGGALDSIADHCGDLALTLGLLWWYLGQGAQLEPILLFVALFGSMLGSQIRARAGMAGIDTRNVGWATRFERLVILIVGLFSNQVSLSLIVLAVLNSLSAAQRLVYVVQAARQD